MNSRLAASNRNVAVGSIAGLGFIMVACTVLQRLGINIGANSVSIALVAVYAALALALLNHRIEVVPSRLAGYALCVCAAIMSAMANRNLGVATGNTSFASLALLFVIYLPFVFRVVADRVDDQSNAALDRYCDVTFICAIAGITQFYAQFFVHASWLFDISPYIPSPIRAVGEFNPIIAAGDHHKANGFFFREPSGFSYIIALGLVAEWLWRRRWMRLAVLTFALVLSYSGTGILALLVALIFPLSWRVALRGIAVVSAGALIYALIGDPLNLAFTLNRVHEFSSTDSSAYVRYIAPMKFLHENLESTRWSLWLGHGPGAISRASQMAYAFHDPTWAKLLYEYGVLGFVSFVALMSAVILRSPIPLQIQAVLLINWLIMGGNLLKAECVVMVFAFCSVKPQPCAVADTKEPKLLVGAAPLQQAHSHSVTSS